MKVKKQSIQLINTDPSNLIKDNSSYIYLFFFKEKKEKTVESKY